MQSLQVTYPRRRRKRVGKGPPPAIFAVFVVFGAAVTLAMLGYVLAGLPYSGAAYITALTIDFFTVVFGFMIALDVIMQQPMEVSERKHSASAPGAARRGAAGPQAAADTWACWRIFQFQGSSSSMRLAG